LKQLSNEIQEILLSSSEKAFQKPELTFSKIEINLLNVHRSKSFPQVENFLISIVNALNMDFNRYHVRRFFAPVYAAAASPRRCQTLNKPKHNPKAKNKIAPINPNL